jgi:hypothetical protein
MPGTRLARRLLVGTLLILLASPAVAGKQRLVPVAPEQRKPLMVEVADLTGTGADTAFASALARELGNDILYLVQHDPLARTDAWSIEALPNPFRAAVAGDEGVVRFHGDLERADYGPASELAGLLEAGLLLGPVLGPLAARPNDRTYAAALLYRFTEAGTTGSAPIVVRVARQADVDQTSRRELMADVSGDAARWFLSQAFLRVRVDGQPRPRLRLICRLPGWIDVQRRLAKLRATPGR